MALIDKILDSILGSPWKEEWKKRKSSFEFRMMLRKSRLEDQKSRKLSTQHQHSESWYFSPEGETAYAALSSDFDRMKFFFDYLNLVAKREDEFYPSWHFGTIYRLAHVMCSSMVNSSLEFGGYPNILDENKNPLIKYVKNNPLIYPNKKEEIYKKGTYCYSDCEKQMIKLLCALHNETDENTKHFLSKNDPYKCLTFCDKNAPLSDMYKIERELLYMFYLSGYYSDEFDKKTFFVPYASSVMLGNVKPEESNDVDSDWDEEN